MKLYLLLSSLSAALLLLCSTSAKSVLWPPWPELMDPKQCKERGRKPGGEVKKTGNTLKTKNEALAKVGITAGSDGMAEAVYMGQFDRWEGKPSVTCTSCNQSTGQIDRHSTAEKPKFLVWTQARRTKASIEWAAQKMKELKSKKMKCDVIDDRFPSGYECYYCYDVRRKFYLGLSQDVLNEQRNKSQEKDDEVNERRSDLVSEGGKFKGNVAKLKTVEKGENIFDKEFVSGTAAKLWDFAWKRHLTAESDEDLIDIIKEKYPTYKIMINKRKEIIVEMLDQTDGEYRFERGTNDYIEYHKLEKYDDDDDFAEAYDNKVAKRAAREMDRTVYGGANVKDLDQLDEHAETQCYPESFSEAASHNPGSRGANTAAASFAAAPPAKPLPQPTSPSPPAQPNTVVILDDTADRWQSWPWQPQSPSDSRRLKSSSHLSLSTTSAVSGGLPVPKVTSSTVTASAARSSATAEAGELEEGQGNGLYAASDVGSSGNGSTALAAAEAAQICPKAQDERIRQEATKALKAIMADFGTDDDHFDHSRQNKACDQAISRLRKHARKCSNSSDDDLRNFGQQLWDCADEVEERQSLFDDGRTKFAQVVTSVPSAARTTIMAVMSEQTICNFVAREAAKLSDVALTNQMSGRSLMLALVGHTADSKPPGLGLNLIKGNDSMVKQCQRPLVGSHLESIYKQPSFHAFYISSNNFVGDLLSNGPQDLEETLNAVPDRIAGNEPLVFGFCPQLVGDMICTLVMGETAKCMSTDTRVPGHLHSLIRALVEQRGKLSGRVRCYHKHIGGVSHTARDIWRIMEKVAENNSEVCECAADDVNSWTALIGEARLRGTQLELLEALCNVTFEARDKLVILGRWLTNSEESGTCSNDELRGCGLNFRCELVEAVARVLKDTDYHHAAMDKNLTVESQPQDQNEVDNTMLVESANGANDPNQTPKADAAATVKDKAFFEDPDNLPDAVAMTCVTHVVCGILKEFPHDGQGNQIYKDAENRANMIYECWRLNQYDITDKFTIFDKLRQFAELSRKFLVWSAPTARVVDETKATYQLQKFVDKATGSDFIEHTCEEYVTSLVADGAANLAAVRRELVALSASMPASTQKIAEATKSFDAVETLAARIKTGKLPPTLMELNQMLHTAVLNTKDVPIALTREPYVKAKTSVGGEYANRFALFEGQINRMDVACQTIKQRAGAIVSEIGTWNFEKTNFVKLPKDKPDEMILNASKAIESSWQSFDNFKNMASQLKVQNSHQPKFIKDKVSEISSKFESGAYAGELKEARVLLAHASLVNIIMNSKKKDDVVDWPIICQAMLNHLKTKLGIDLQNDLETNFAIKLRVLDKNPAAGQAQDDVATLGAAKKTAAKGKPKANAKSEIKKAATTASCASTAAPPSEAAELEDVCAPTMRLPPSQGGPETKFRRRM